MNFSSFFQNHYEKLILAVFLILFGSLLYMQLTIIKEARDQEVDKIVNAEEPPADFKAIDYEVHPRFRMDTVFANQNLEWNQKDKADAKSIADLMTPTPMAICPHCFLLISSSYFPQKGSAESGKCMLCSHILKPRTSDLAVAEEETVVVDDADENGLPDKWEKQYDIVGQKGDVDSDKDGFTNKEEFLAKTNPKDVKSHPLYVTKLKLASKPQKQTLESLLDESVKKDFTGTIRLKSISAGSSDKAKWEANFTFKQGKNSRTLSTKFGDEILYRNKTSNDKVPPSIKFKVADIVDAKNKKDQKVIIESTVGEGEKLRMECYIGKRIMTPYDLIVFENITDKSRVSAKTGAAIQLGSEATGIEKYTIASVEGKDDNVVVTLVGADNSKWPIKLTHPDEEAAAAEAAAAAKEKAGAAEQKPAEKK